MGEIKRIFEEEINTLIHGIGLALSIIGLTLIVFFSVRWSGKPIYIVSCSIYGATLVLLFLASTLLHGTLSRGLDKQIFKTFDYSAIYLLIAGSFTPILLLSVKGTFGWVMFFIVWGVAVLGILHKIFMFYKFELFSKFSYLLMGLLCFIAIKPLIANLSWVGFSLLMLGGAFYIVGFLVFFMRDHKFKFNHAIWHGFVLSGSILHFFTILFFVLLIPLKSSM